jgi:hypothetical protein
MEKPGQQQDGGRDRRERQNEVARAIEGLAAAYRRCALGVVGGSELAGFHEGRLNSLALEEPSPVAEGEIFELGNGDVRFGHVGVRAKKKIRF